jgi:tetratricopeptide (TPR) repeat protein
MVFAIALFLLLVRSVIRIGNWKDGITLFDHDEAISNVSYDLENQLGYLYLFDGKADAAKSHIDRSIQLAPLYWENWNNLGVYYEAKGQIDQSIAAFKTSIKMNDNYLHGYVSLVTMYYHYKSPDEAKIYIEKALHKYPKYPYFLYLENLVSKQRSQ